MDHIQFKVRCRAIILHKGKLLTVSHKGSNGTIYALPGGHLELGENPVEGTIREIKEELDINPQIGRLLYVHIYNPLDGTIPSIEFFYEVMNGHEFYCIDNTCATHAYELEDIKWMEFDEKLNLLPQKICEDFKNGHLLESDIRYI